MPDAPTPAVPRRVYIVGLAGSGKTSLARRLAQRYGLRHIEIDALHWQPNWQETPKDELYARVKAMLDETPRWTADGNYSVLRGLLWTAADTIIWLDYSLGLVLWRLWRRTWQRVFSREELWNGNRETLRGALFSKDSLFLYVLRVHRRRKRTYEALFAERANPGAVYLRFRHPRELAAWRSEEHTSELQSQ